MSEFVATLSDLKDVDKVPEDFRGVVNFKVDLEKRVIRGDERVAILNIADTLSYFVVFLDKDKSIEDIDREVREGAHAVLNADTREVLKRILRAK
ncbi:MAG: DUF749 family protein [Candidatus Hydrothermarchaeales archaeon]